MWWMRKETGTSYKKRARARRSRDCVPPDEAANDDPGGGCPVFPPPFRGGSAGAAPGDGRQHGPLFTAPPGCGIHSGNPLPEPPGGGCDFVLPGGGTGPGSSPGPEPVCRRLVSGGRGCPDLDGGGTAGANSRGGDLAQPKWGKGVSGQASGPAGTLGPVVGSAALAAPAAPVGCQSA